jgi:hypothetical protein
MEEIVDECIGILYAIVRQDEDASFGEDQKEAARQIKKLASSGDPDAAIALNRLKHAPGMHPFLREIIFS